MSPGRPASKTCLPLALAVLSVLGACSRPSADGEGAEEQNSGSYTLTSVVEAWSEAYQGPDVATVATSSAAGIAALIDGSQDLAIAARHMTDSEKEAARGQGFEPVEHVVGLDALAVYLQHDNPAEFLSLEQLADIYGAGGTTETWSQVIEYAIPGCDSDQIERFSRPADSDTGAFFERVVLGGEREARSDTEIDDPRELVDRVKKTPCSIGYSSLAHAVEHVKLACISESESTDGEEPDCTGPSPATTASQSYPIIRPLVVITRGEPRGPVKAYLDWILSSAGQCILERMGYTPVESFACQ